MSLDKVEYVNRYAWNPWMLCGGLFEWEYSGRTTEEQLQKSDILFKIGWI